MGETMSRRSPNMMMLGILLSLVVFFSYGEVLGLLSFLGFYAYTSL